MFQSENIISLKKKILELEGLDERKDKIGGKWKS